MFSVVRNGAISYDSIICSSSTVRTPPDMTTPRATASAGFGDITSSAGQGDGDVAG